jgi:hypothetical protein
MIEVSLKQQGGEINLTLSINQMKEKEQNYCQHTV